MKKREPKEIIPGEMYVTLPGRTEEQPNLMKMPIRLARDHFERAYFEELMLMCGGSVAAMAKYTEMERTHLYRKLRMLGVEISGQAPQPDTRARLVELAREAASIIKDNVPNSDYITGLVAEIEAFQ